MLVNMCNQLGADFFSSRRLPVKKMPGTGPPPGSHCVSRSGMLCGKKMPSASQTNNLTPFGYYPLSAHGAADLGSLAPFVNSSIYSEEVAEFLQITIDKTQQTILGYRPR